MIGWLRLAALALFLAAVPARAETLLVTMSERTVDITSNFTGSSITVFGAVRRDASTVPRASDYDVVVTVTGPRADRVTRLKDRVAGIWINRHAEAFEDVPTAYTVLSNRPIEDIAHPALLTRFQIGIDYLLASSDEPNTAGADGDTGEAETLDDMDTSERPADHVFERAFLRLQRESGQYQEDPEGGAVIDNTLFRARATFPADVPLGNFEVRVFLFSGGALLAEEQVGIVVRKTGFEQFVFRLSQTDPFIYGALVILLAAFTGWLGGVVFRRS